MNNKIEDRISLLTKRANVLDKVELIELQAKYIKELKEDIKYLEQFRPKQKELF